jgi:hypothetical protein
MVASCKLYRIMAHAVFSASMCLLNKLDHNILMQSTVNNQSIYFKDYIYLHKNYEHWIYNFSRCKKDVKTGSSLKKMNDKSMVYHYISNF